MTVTPSGNADIRLVEGHVACGAGIPVIADCVGESFNTKTKSFDLVVTLPRFNYDLQLVAPEWHANATNPADLKEQEGDFKWGVITAWENAPDGSQLPITARVDRWRIEFLVEFPAGASFSSTAWSAMEEIDEWWELFSSWLEIITSHNISTRRTSGGIRAEPIWIWDASDLVSRRNAGVARSGQVYNQTAGAPVDVTTLEACMRLAADGQPPPDMWMFIRDARALIARGDFRRAVIDAGTAAELAMTEILDQDLAAADTVLHDALIGRSRTLEGRSKLMRELGAGLVPTNFKNDLQEPRNKAAHSGVPQTLASATKALEVATNLVEQAEPSLGLIPESDSD
ncbi:hypothetical protein [Mycobacteroides chelonae]|uniref:hypothetical protein n=1 Tax=Mycobacteroides TaxID=670516 RepID=UPI000A809BC1|nr:hypothetical protein [Mycobacteroides chelonae]AYM41164.1 hypothetical protein DYE20_06025 [[Mycobacterium] chelonae subsp. gwanakae]GLE56086.1 hypothetical protein NJBCHELONAE_13940 [Mycobacteroides chelonae]